MSQPRKSRSSSSISRFTNLPDALQRAQHNLWKAATLGEKITQETVDYINPHPEFGFNPFGELTSDEESRNNTFFGEEFSSEGYCDSDLETVLPESPTVQNQFDLNMADQNEQIQNEINDRIDNSDNMDINPQPPHIPIGFSQ
jgi:hypothetical protein